MALAASSLIFESPNSSASFEEEQGEDDLGDTEDSIKDEDLEGVKDFQFEGIHDFDIETIEGVGGMSSTDAVDGADLERVTSDEQCESEPDLIQMVEDSIKDSLPEFRPDSDFILWHYDPNEFENFEIELLEFSSEVVYPELLEVNYNGVLVAHVERDAYGI